MIDLSKRLLKAKGYLHDATVVFDIGADHGLLSLALAKEGKKVYACENKIGPYETLVKSVKGSIYPVTCLYSDGIDVLPNDVKTLVLLGMGGKTIAEILSRHPDKLSQIESILVEPQSDVLLCVSTLNSFGFQNVDGSYIYEKRYYPILFYVRGKEELNEVERQFGLAPLQKKDPILMEFLNIEKSRIESLNQQGKMRNLSYYKLVLEALAYDKSE